MRNMENSFKEFHNQLAEQRVAMEEEEQRRQMRELENEKAKTFVSYGEYEALYNELDLVRHELCSAQNKLSQIEKILKN